MLGSSRPLEEEEIERFEKGTEKAEKLDELLGRPVARTDEEGGEEEEAGEAESEENDEVANPEIVPPRETPWGMAPPA